MESVEVVETVQSIQIAAALRQAQDGKAVPTAEPLSSLILKIPQFETGNPPEGWESEGQIRNIHAASC